MHTSVIQLLCFNFSLCETLKNRVYVLLMKLYPQQPSQCLAFVWYIKNIWMKTKVFFLFLLPTETMTMGKRTSLPRIQ